jgi:hypothetical protein
MLSRKEFFKELLFRAIRAADGMAAGSEGASAEPIASGPGFDLPATELSPSLLATEAERRVIDFKADQAEGLRREIYQELEKSGPGTRTAEP